MVCPLFDDIATRNFYEVAGNDGNDGARSIKLRTAMKCVIFTDYLAYTLPTVVYAVEPHLGQPFDPHCLQYLVPQLPLHL